MGKKHKGDICNAFNNEYKFLKNKNKVYAFAWIYVNYIALPPNLHLQV